MKLDPDTSYEAWDAIRRRVYPQGKHARYETYVYSGAYTFEYRGRRELTGMTTAYWCTGTGYCFLSYTPEQ